MEPNFLSDQPAATRAAAEPRTTLILTRSQTEGLVTMAEVIAAVEAAHADISAGRAAQPAPTAVSLPSGSAAFLAMSALADRQGLAAVKLLADLPGNAALQLPTQRSVILLVSQATGACQAILHGQIPTRIRTAAVSAVATRHLARPDSATLGLIGAGALAIEHVHAIAQVRPIDRVVVWSRTPATIARFADRIAEHHPTITVEGAATPRDAAATCDILCTLTPSRDPIVQGAWFTPGLHVNAVGAPPRPDHREIDSVGMARGRIFLDSIATAKHESGDLLLALAEGTLPASAPLTELGEVIRGTAPGRTSLDEITLYNSVGIAMQDVAIATLMVTRARALGVGLEIDLGA